MNKLNNMIKNGLVFFAVASESVTLGGHMLPYMEEELETILN